MKALAQHLACLHELDRDRRRLGRAEVVGIVAGASLVALALAGCHYLEELALGRLGLR